MERKIVRRAAVAAAYLVCVNLLAGWAAVTFRYASLWGNSDVFAEYAVPLPFTWALVHWLSMTPLALAIFAMPEWEARRVRHVRLLLLGILIASVTLDLVMGGGRWHRVPFLLFPIIDAITALGLSFLRSKRAVCISAAIASVGAIAALTLPNLIADLRSERIEADLEQVRSDRGWFRSAGVASEGPETIYRLAFVSEAEGPTEDELCFDALSAYERMLELREPDERTDPLLRFVTNAPDPHVLGEARYSQHGRWLCDIAYVGQSQPSRAAAATRRGPTAGDSFR